ncbi:MAG TPA: PIN domain-containing protein [Candidatus Eremiobacteraceae bacterium]|nr:PIN domain-containing protein [Candidatus Eremiobacteraceae bacterium]
MSGKAFVDTNVLVYAHDQGTAMKQGRSQELLARLWTEKKGVISTQVLEEFCVSVRRKFVQPLSLDETRAAIRAYGQWHVVVNSADSVLRALEIEQRYQLSFWDALIIQAAGSAGCEVLYSEDFSNGQEYEGVLVVNPFQES